MRSVAIIYCMIYLKKLDSLNALFHYRLKITVNHITHNQDMYIYTKSSFLN